MDLRKALLESGDQIEKILKGQIGMQPTDDVELGDGLGITGGGRLKRFFQRHGVSARRVLLTPERAQAARSHANIRRVQMAVNVEICLVAMHAFADVVGHPAHSQNVAGPIESQGVIRVQAHAGYNLVVDRYEAGVVSLE